MAERTCSVDDCDSDGPIRRGWCDLHYNRWYFHGDPLWEPPRHQNKGATCCADEPCDKPARTKGLCKNHYYRWRTHGTTGPVPGTSPAERLWASTDKNGPIPEHRPDLGACWVPTGDFREGAYGYIWVDGRNVGAHRLAYELEVEPIPDGLVIDHICRNPPCRNPAHLEPVTDRVNILRGIGPAARNAVKMKCDHGHEFTEANTYLVADGGRQCKACSLTGHREAARRRGAVPMSARMYCPKRHLYDEANTYRDPSGKRNCRTCKNERQRARRRAEREARNAGPAPAMPLVLF